MAKKTIIGVKCDTCEKFIKFDIEDTNIKYTCPRCGDQKNSFYNLSDGEASPIFTFTTRSEKPDLLLKTVLEFENKTAEGTLIKAVSMPWFEILRLIDKDPKVAFELSPQKWEEIIAGAYKKAGFDQVTLTPRSGDYGRDVIAIKKGIGSVRIIDQVKAYKPSNRVTANDVRALAGILENDKASKGFLTTTSDFAPRLKDDPLIKPFIPSRIELINGENLLKRLSELSKSEQKF